ncbi:TonB-dependent receptor plug domain-containing protein [Candidatus Auribacterota bacterium]
MPKKVIAVMVVVLFCLNIASAFAEPIPLKTGGEEALKEELRWLQAEMNIMIETASGIEESLINAPATMIVITAEDIKQRGYTDLPELFMDLPGFDVMMMNGAAYVFALQRGYRVPATARTLFMINGVVENYLWSTEADISRQYPMSNIKRVEVLYGPASAVYGPNAFLGIINVITYDGSELNPGESDITINGLAGSYNSKGIDVAVRGKFKNDIAFGISGRIYKSDEPDFTGKAPFLEQRFLEDRKIWGPLLDMEHYGRQLGSYYDPTDDNGVLATVQYKNLKLGLIHSTKLEGYGPYYAADRIQPNTFWNRHGKQLYGEYEIDIIDNIKSKTFLLYRESRRYGLQAEAYPDPRPGMSDYSFISFTEWNSISNSWLFKQNFEASLKDNVTLVGGLKYERKELTKAYDAPGYWLGAYSSSSDATDPGPYGLGSAIGHSTDAIYTPPPPPLPAMPADNLAHTDDIGGYILGILDFDPLRYNLGIRYDDNSLYGSSVNPRASIIYKSSEDLIFKLMYGKAFQEPPAIFLWGGWSGRNANTALKPERAQNIEFVIMHQLKHFLQQISFFSATYKDVVISSTNAGERDITGLEYRAKCAFSNFIANSANITGYVNYSWTQSKTSRSYNHTTSSWQDVEADLGDIAPHKFNIGLNVPVGEKFNVNLRGNFVGERTPYTGNPLRAQNYKFASYFVLNGVLTYMHDHFDISFKILNISDKEYFHPGGGMAVAGTDTTQRSMGFQNSIIPQPGRSYWINARVKY